ncbi:Ctr copper transporter [Dichomitus squalens]|uniref:Copper transport protein n=1 Tax=Dichomitus squalens TaxID=114155 RepID=A0A4Q9N4V9_9APHY|nr:Ctr copper transporter [Dichomitus squalens]
MDTMIPWLHFTSGDKLLFEAWQPSSKGAIAGACIGLLLFAIFERWVNGMRGVLEAQWKKQCVPRSLHTWLYVDAIHAAVPRALAAMSSPASRDECHSSDPSFQNPSNSPDSKSAMLDGVEEVEVNPLATKAARRPQRSSRMIPPFIPSHDVPRGALFAFQALLFYVLMLAVMTFQAGYLISIVVGLAIGEVLFGRFGSRSHPGHH